MKIILLLIIFNIHCITTALSISPLTLPINEPTMTMTDFFITEIRDIVIATLNSITEKSEAKTEFASIYSNTNTNADSNEAYTMLYNHLTLSSNDLSLFTDCNVKESTHKYEYKYIIATILNPNKTKAILSSALFQSIESKYTFGFCIVKSAYNESFLKDFIIQLNKQTTNLISSIDITLPNLILTDYESSSNEVKSTAKNGFSIFLIVLLITLIGISLLISLIVWTKCFTFKGNNCLVQFINVYNIKKSLESLFDSNANKDTIQKDSTLTYVNGLRSISMILFICGSMVQYITIYTMPVITIDSYYTLINGIIYSIFLLGLRHCSHIFLSCSGFSFFVKYYYYLDECSSCINGDGDDDSERNKSVSQAIEFTTFNLDISDHMDHNRNELDDNPEHERVSEPKSNLIQMEELIFDKEDSTQLRFKYSILFILNHLYKYILLLLAVFFMKYILYYIIDVSPGFILWYNDTLSHVTIEDIIGHLLYYKSLYPDQIYNLQACLLNFFWVPLSEVLYLTLFTPLIYIVYKKQIKAPTVILLLYFIFLLAKILTFSLIGNKGDIAFIATFDYNPLLNTSFYLIGMLFGLFNYVIQKGLDYNDVVKGSKSSFVTGVFITQRLRRWTCVPVMYFILTVLILAIVFTNFIIESAVGDVSLSQSLNEATWLNVVHYVSMDLLALFIHLLFFTMYIRGEHLITDFLSAGYWSKINKHYFSLLLLIPIVSLFILFKSETRIGIDYPTILIYMFLLGVLLTIIQMIQYLVLEYPIKMMFKLMIDKIGIKVK